MSPRVLNRKTDGIPAGAVYVGRPTRWGNHFTHLPSVARRPGMVLCETREEAVERYAEWLPGSALDPTELRGRDLVCWCSPEPCHADVLLGLANP